MHLSVTLFLVFLFGTKFCKVHATCVSSLYQALPCYIKSAMANYPNWLGGRELNSSQFTFEPVLLSLKNDMLNISCNITTQEIQKSHNSLGKSAPELNVSSVKNGFTVVYIPTEDIIYRGVYKASGTLRNTRFYTVNGTFTSRFQTPRQIITYENVKLDKSSKFIDLHSVSITHKVIPRYSGPAYFNGIKLANESEGAGYTTDNINEAIQRLYYCYIFVDNMNDTRLHPDVKLLNSFFQEELQETPVSKIVGLKECRPASSAPSKNILLSDALSIWIALVGIAAHLNL